MDCQVHFAEPTLSEDLFQLVLPEAAAGIKVLAFRGVKNGFIFNVGEVVIVVFSAV